MRASFLHWCLLGPAVISTAVAQIRTNLELVALQRDPCPSVAPEATHGIVGFFPHIARDGTVAFSGFVRDAGDADYAVWKWHSGITSAIAVEGDITPGRPDETLQVFTLSSGGQFMPLSDGSVTFWCRTQTSGNEGLWQGTPGNLREVAIGENPGPIIPGSTLKRFPGFTHVANGAGLVLVKASFEGGGTTAGNDTAIWLSRPGEHPVIVAREGDPVPGLNAGVTYDDLVFANLSLSESRHVCYLAGLKGPGLIGNNALFAGPADSPMLMIRKGEPVPGEPGERWDSIRNPRINNQGDLAFEAAFRPGGPRRFFIREANGNLVQVAQEGQEAAGTDGEVWSDFFISQIYLAGNFAAFAAGLADGGQATHDGIWIHKRGTGTSLVAQAGDPAPGLPGLTFEGFDPPLLNEQGMVVFHAWTTAGDDGLWLYRDGEIHLLLADGEEVLIRPGDVRRISSFNLRLGSSPQSGFRSALNDRGELVLRTSFNTGPLGTAIFKINLADLDGGGTDDLLEEAFGGDPDDGADDLAILPVMSRDGTGPTLSFRRMTDGSFLYEVQIMSPGGEWLPATGIITSSPDQSGLPDGIERVRFAPPAATDRAMIRIKVSRP